MTNHPNRKQPKPIYTGLHAIYAAERGENVTLCKYNDPIEDAREHLTIDEAYEIAREDAGLIYARAE